MLKFTGLSRRYFSTHPNTFDKVLIANRGEISRRVIRTCKEMGIKTVAVYSDADRYSMFVKEADEAYRIGPPETSLSYLNQDVICDVIKASGAQAVHPGYGFLSENATFSQRLADSGVAFIGPPGNAIQAMGDKIESKKLAREANVNTVPGFLGEMGSEEEVLKISNEIGYPVMIKASAGGGGKGMRIAFDDAEAVEGFRLSKEEALSSFGDDRVFIEKYIVEPRHIEFQILGDMKGNYVYLPERECSVQRRNQKVVEEAPSMLLTPEVRASMGKQACAMAASCGYYSTGTVEFLVDRNMDFYFLEMNTRLQVEHPITEQITGIDLVEEMIKIAAGYDLSYTQDQVVHKGHSVELRVYAEDPARKFLPSIGFLSTYQEPKPHPQIRIDTGVTEGSEISMYYDPMISKLVTTAETRDEALDIMDKAIDQYVVQGVTDNLGFGKAIINNPAFRSGKYDTSFIESFYPEGYHGEHLEEEDRMVLALAAARVKNHLSEQSTAQGADVQVFDTVFTDLDEHTYKVEVNHLAQAYVVTDLTTGESKQFGINSFSIEKNTLIDVKVTHLGELQHRTFQFRGTEAELDYHFYYKEANRKMRVYSETEYSVKHHMPPPKVIDYSMIVISPMPGKIVSIAVQVGETVADGQEMCVVEAMKMQNIIKSERDGVIKKITVIPGDSVEVDETLIEFE